MSQMTHEQWVAECGRRIAIDEGRRLLPYRDNLGVLTAGIGFNLERGDARTALRACGANPDNIFAGGSLTDAQCDALFAADLMHVRQLLDVYCPWWSSLDGIDGPRSNVLVNAGFNLGVAGLATFHRFLHYMEMGEWDNAAVDLRMTLVFKQLPARYGRLQTQILTGVFQ